MSAFPVRCAAGHSYDASEWARLPVAGDPEKQGLQHVPEDPDDAHPEALTLRLRNCIVCETTVAVDVRDELAAGITQAVQDPVLVWPHPLSMHPLALSGKLLVEAGRLEVLARAALRAWLESDGSVEGDSTDDEGRYFSAELSKLEDAGNTWLRAVMRLERYEKENPG